MSEEENENDLSNKRITDMIASMEQLARANGDVREYLTALTVSAGRVIYGMPDQAKQQQTLRTFIQSLHDFGARHAN
jgi:hypothetical protein